VETALTMPLTLFLILGTLQLFLVMQGRIMAEYAAFRATRAGSLAHGNCTPMQHAAILALLPSFHSYIGSGFGRPAQRLAESFRLHRNNRYSPLVDNRYFGEIVWIVRDSPRTNQVPAIEDRSFDQHRLMRLETRLVYFFPLKIPFANKVFAQMVLAQWGWLPFMGTNPLMVNQRAIYRSGSTDLEGAIRSEVVGRYLRSEYVLPIHASGSMRMMTPARRMYFENQNCSGRL
jgi:hypothetical protein